MVQWTIPRCDRVEAIVRWEYNNMKSTGMSSCSGDGAVWNVAASYMAACVHAHNERWLRVHEKARGLLGFRKLVAH
jgi:hypothetical protein